MMIRFRSFFHGPATLFYVAWAKLRGFEILADSDEVLERLTECEDCSELTEDRDCRLCTCPVDAKTLLLTEQCPKRLWLRIWRKRGTI